MASTPDPRQHPNADVAADVEHAIATRRSVRGFLPDAVPDLTLRAILESSARAPSGTNIQPWKVYVLDDATKSALTERVLAIHYTPEARTRGYHRQYYANPMFEPYLARRRQVGWALYGLCGIEKGDKEKMLHQHARNYRFFDAPAALMFTIDVRMEIGSWLDYGMFLENIMLSARAHGLHTCPQAAWAQYDDVVRETLGIDDSECVVCGMAIGFEDTSRAENALRTPRAPLDDWVTFCGQ